VRKFLRVILVFSFLLTIFSVVFADSAEQPEYLVEDTTGSYGGTLYLPLAIDPSTYNIVVSQQRTADEVIYRFSEGLLDFDKQGEIRGGALAKSWEFTDGGKSIVFHIRKGLKWSDGYPFTGEDVYWCWKYIWTDETNAGDWYDKIVDQDRNPPKVELLDEYTVKITYSKPFAPGLRTIGSAPVLPKHVLEEAVKNGKWLETWSIADIGKLVGMGPFIPVEHIPDVKVVLKRNPYYYRVDKDGKQLPYLDQLVYLICPDQNTMRLRFEAGELDAFNPRPYDYPDIKAMAREKNWVVEIDGPNFGTEFVAFNWNCPDPVKRNWFRNEHFRKAVAHALDKVKIVETVFNGLGTPQYGPVSAASPFYNPEVEKYSYPYSLTLAKQELKKAGFSWDENGKLIDSEGNQVKFILTTNVDNTIRVEVANILVDSLKKLGMDVIFTPLDFNAVVQKVVTTGDWEAVVLGLLGDVDPHYRANVWMLDGGLRLWNFSPKRKKFVDPEDYHVEDWEKEVHDIYVKEVTEIDPQKRKELFNKFQIIVAQHLPLVYTVQQVYIYAYKKEVHNLEPSPFGGLTWNVYKVWKDTK